MDEDGRGTAISSLEGLTATHPPHTYTRYGKGHIQGDVQFPSGPELATGSCAGLCVTEWPLIHTRPLTHLSVIGC